MKAGSGKMVHPARWTVPSTFYAQALDVAAYDLQSEDVSYRNGTSFSAPQVVS
jgi:hypothetical protein